MGKISKTVALFLTLIIALSCLTLLIMKPANAQTSTPYPTPSIPQFTVKFVDSSYDVPTTTSINPYTGQTVTTQGYHVENRTIELIIDNQPFNAYSDAHGSYPFLYYNVREKGHFAENWTEIYNPDNDYLIKSNSDYTVLSFGVPFEGSGQIDYQVEALVGGIFRNSPQFASGYHFEGVASGWSPTQTVTIPASSVSPSPTSTVPELSWLVIVPLFVFTVIGVVAVRYRFNIKKRHQDA